MPTPETKTPRPTSATTKPNQIYLTTIKQSTYLNLLEELSSAGRNMNISLNIDIN